MRTLSNYLFMVFALSVVIPFVQAVPNMMQISLLCMVLWLAIYVAKEGVGVFDSVIVAVAIYTYFLSFSTGNLEVGNRYLVSTLSFLCYSVYRFEFGSVGKVNYKTLVLILSLTFVTCITTIIALFDNPYISRSIKSSGEHSVSLSQSGVGGYSFIYYCVFLTVAVFVFFRWLNTGRGKRITLRGSLIAGMLTASLVVVMSNFFTALILTIFGVLLISTINVGGKKSIYGIKVLFLIVFFSFLALWGKDLTASISEGLAKISGGGRTSERIELISRSFASGEGFGEVAEGRDDVRTASINTFLNNPILGVIPNNYQSSSDEFQIIGNHSYILDTFAFYGMPVGFAILFLMAYPFCITIKNSQTRFIKLSTLIIMLMYFVLNYLNTFTPSVSVVVFYIYPILCRQIDTTVQSKRKFLFKL